jgi:anaerobic selenocysteine-containing dehydrogenase
MAVETKTMICPLCSTTCGLEISHDDRSVQEVRGAKDDTFSKGYICPKGVAIKELDADPDRLRAPMIRRGTEWHEVSWDEAFAEIDRKFTRIIEEHGRNALGAYIGNPAGKNIGFATLGIALLKAMGTTNVFTASTVDQMPKQLSSAWMFGTPASTPVPDLSRCEYLIVLGANPIVSGGSMMVAPNVGEYLKGIQARGGKIVVIDPAYTKTAAMADEHFFIRPGTDALFLLAMVHTLFEENLVSLGPLEAHCNGIGEIEQLAKEFTPESVSDECGITAEDIRKITREFAASPAAAMHARMGTCTQEFGTLASWLPDVIHVLTGNLDRPGGAMFPLAALGSANTKGTPGSGRAFKTGRRKSRVSGYDEVMGEFPSASMAEEIDTPGDGQIRGLFTYCGNPVLSNPNGDRIAAALESLEFLVSCDIYLNETTRHAHVILPGLSHLECSQFQFSAQLSTRNVARYSPPVFDVPEGQQPDWKTVLRLAGIFALKGSDPDLAALDDEAITGMIEQETRQETSPIHGRDTSDILAALSPWCGPERVLDLKLRTGPRGDGFGANSEGLTLQKLIDQPEGIDFGPLQPRIPEMLRTPSGKIELTPEPILADIPRLRARQKRANGELLLINRRHMRSNNSWMHNIPLLVSGKPRCTLLIHPHDAAAAGIEGNDTVRVSSQKGALNIVAEITEDIMPGVVSIPHGWGHDVKESRMEVAEAHAGVNCNVLGDERALDVPSGNASLFGVPVKIESAMNSA